MKNLMILATLALAACGQGNSPQADISAERSYLSEAALTRIETALNNSAKCVDQNSDLCRVSDYEVTFSKPSSRRESIMVIDQIGKWSMIGKYFDRTRAFEIDQHANLYALNFKIPLSKGMQDIIAELRTAGSSTSTQDSDLYQARTGKIFMEMAQNTSFNRDLNSIGLFGHGNTIFGYLAENNPDADLLAVTGLMFPPQVLCDWRNGAVANYARELAKNLAYLANSNNVAYINASFGFSYSLAKSRLERECPDLPEENQITEIVAQQHFLFQELARLTDAQIIQAANENVEDWRQDREISDCSDDLNKNRKRVGYYFGTSAEYSSETFAVSQMPPHKYPSTLGPRMACVDILIDSGFVQYLSPSKMPFEMTIDGLIYDRNFLISTSYATPIALTFLRKQAQRMNTTPDQTFQLITGSGQNKFVHWGSSDRER